MSKKERKEKGKKEKSMLSPICKSVQLSSRPLLRCANQQYTRSIRTRSLEHLQRDAPLDGLLSTRGLKTAWFDRMEMYTRRLNECTGMNEELQQMSLESLILQNGRSASRRDILTYASLLYNLEFAMSCLRKPTLSSSISASASPGLPVEGKPGREALLQTPDLSITFTNEPISSGCKNLQQELQNSFGSIVEFRTLLLNSNMAISGDGFTWLLARKFKNSFNTDNVTTGDEVLFDKLFVLNTYNAGSPFNSDRVGVMTNLRKQYLARRDQAQAQDQGNSTGVDSTGRVPLQQDGVPTMEAAKLTAYDQDTTYIPLLAIDASPKVWLHDYGVFGKQMYLDRVWESINWPLVESRLPKKSSVIYN